MEQFLIENKEIILSIIGGIVLFIIREVVAPAVRHFVQSLPTRWHLDPATGQLVLKGIDKMLEKRFGKTAMLMNAWTDPGPAEELLKNEIMRHVEKKFDATIDKNKKGSK